MWKKLSYLLLAILFGGICFLILTQTGKVAVIEHNCKEDGIRPEDCTLAVRDPENAFFVDKTEYGEETIKVWLKSTSSHPRKVEFDLYDPDKREEGSHLIVFYVHSGGIITQETFFGKCRGDWLIGLFAFLYLAVLVADLCRTLWKDCKKNLYQYRNIKILGLLLFFTALDFFTILFLSAGRGLEGFLYSFVEIGDTFSYLTFPIALVLSICVTISNIRLMKREGFGFRNMLGCFLGVALCFWIILPIIYTEIMYRSFHMNDFFDVHRGNGTGRHIELLIRTSTEGVVFYLVCVLAAASVLSYIAAKRKPSLDRDYVLILGCKVRADGTPTPLLKGRADKALELVRKQEEAVGKAPIFVASGGKGSDEVISEAACIASYLESQGVSKEQILIEDRSVSTRENMKFSYEVIQNHRGGEMDGVKTAYATTNYHVFRSGVLATEAGFDIQGVGSSTKAYFWINAFIREFIATMSKEWKTHVYIMALIFLCDLAIVSIIYCTVNL